MCCHAPWNACEIACEIGHRGWCRGPVCMDVVGRPTLRFTSEPKRFSGDRHVQREIAGRLPARQERKRADGANRLRNSGFERTTEDACRQKRLALSVFE